MAVILFLLFNIVCCFDILSTCCRFNEFGVDGGPAAKELVPKFNIFKRNLSSKLGVALPNIDVRPFYALSRFSC